MVFNPFSGYTSSGNPFQSVSLSRPTSTLPSISYTPLASEDSQDPNLSICREGYRWDPVSQSCVPIEGHTSSGSAPHIPYEVGSDLAVNHSGPGSIPIGSQFIGNDGLVHTVGYGEGQVDPGLASSAIRNNTRIGNFLNPFRTIGRNLGLISHDINEGQITTSPVSQQAQANQAAEAQALIDRRQEEAEANRAAQRANEQRSFRTGGGGIHRNDGGIIYAQEGLPVVPGEIPAAGLPIEPQMPLPMPQQAPMAPEMPNIEPPMPKKSFAEKVAEAKAYIEGKPTEVPATPIPMMTDGQGDGGVYGDVDYSMEELGPDLGPDTVDAKLTPGEAVIPKEAVDENPEMVNGLIARGREIQEFNKGGIANKISKIYKEGYTSPGQAYAIAKSMGYNKGGVADDRIELIRHLEQVANNPSIPWVTRRDIKRLIIQIKDTGLYRNTGGLIAPMYAQEGAFLGTPQSQAVGQFLYETSAPGGASSTALTDHNKLIASGGATGSKAGELFEAFDSNNKKIFAQSFTKNGQVKYISDGIEYNSLGEIPNVASSWERAAGTSIGETQAKNFDDIYREELKEMNTGLQAAKQIKRKAGEIVNIIKRNVSNFGAGIFRGGGIRSWLQTAENLTGIQADVLIGDSPAVSSVNAILKSQLIDLVAAARARGTTFGAMTEAEWRLLGEQLGDITDSAGGIYAIQKYLLDASDIDIEAIEARINWWKQEARKGNYQADLSDFDTQYDSEADRVEVQDIRAQAIKEGREINSGVNPDDTVEKPTVTVQGSSGTLSNGYDENKLVNIIGISETELPSWIDKGAYIQNEGTWGRDYDDQGYVYRWHDRTIRSDRWEKADASALI